MHNDADARSADTHVETEVTKEELFRLTQYADCAG